MNGSVVWSRRRRIGATAVALAGLGLAGCGQQRQDAMEPRRDFEATASASLPSSQDVPDPVDLVIRVRNLADRTMPQATVTLRGLDRRVGRQSASEPIADPVRPIWLVDSQPQNAPVADKRTWTTGPLRAGDEATFRWRLTPVHPGNHRITWRVGAAVDGKSRAVDDVSGDPLRGTLTATVSKAAGGQTFDPDTGEPRDKTR